MAANWRLTSRYQPRPLTGRFHRPRIASWASRCVSSPAATCALRWRSWALMTSLWSLPWCSTSQGPPSCLQVMVFMGGKLALPSRGGFSNPDRLSERLRGPGVGDPPECPRLEEPAGNELPQRGIAAGVSGTHPRADDGVVYA